MAITSKRLPSLDGLRALSIGIVILVHAVASGGFSPKFAARLDMFITGELGVRVFFVISGFLITTLLLKEERSAGSISILAFYQRRAFRIWPVYYFYILVILLINALTNYTRATSSTFVSAATFTTRLWGDWSLRAWPLSHSWSLAVEEQFYLLWPLALVVVPRGKGIRRFIVAVIIIITPVVRALFYNFGDRSLIGNLFVTQADAIMFGCLLALYLDKDAQQASKIFSFRPQAMRIIALLAICAPCLIWKGCFFVSINPTIAGIAIAYLIGSFVVYRAGIGYAFLNNGFVAWIGILSYSLYIWQQIVLFPYEISKGYWFQRVPQSIGIVFILAIASHYLIEKPFLAMKDRRSLSKLQTGNS